ncbi:MAG TPA: hypothetical protein VGN61_07525, partial [Verrucomicrobiae bacterium]
DNLFAFAKAAGVKVIYTFRLLNGDKDSTADLAQYIQRRYGAQLDYFCLGNEPDWRSYHNKDPEIKDYPSYLRKWRMFAQAIIASDPGAKFGGPDTGSDYPIPNTKNTDYNGASWTEHFALDVQTGGRLVAILQHDYIGQSAKGVSIPAAIDAMLSADWVNNDYPALYNHVLAPIEATHQRYRMTECNDFTGGIDGASDAFASALWALDYMYWQAAHRAVGVNFHNKRWIYTDTIYLDHEGNLQIHPKAYGLKAFDLGSHGDLIPVTIFNPDAVNLTAYAVHESRNMYVTIINKSHGSGAQGVDVMIAAGQTAPHAESISLSAPNDDPAAMTGVRLGGASITNDAPWLGKWTLLPSCEVNVAPASATIVKIFIK